VGERPKQERRTGIWQINEEGERVAMNPGGKGIVDCRRLEDEGSGNRSAEKRRKAKENGEGKTRGGGKT